MRLIVFMIFLLKVLVISDIKKDLGYIGSSSGHREWRQVNDFAITF